MEEVEGRERGRGRRGKEIAKERETGGKERKELI